MAIIANGNYERVASSGAVSEVGALEQSKSNIHQLNRILLSLIEEELELSYRSQNCLNHAGIRLIGQLVQKSEAQLLNLNNFGRTSLREIIGVLLHMNLTLEMNLDFPPWSGDNNGAELIRILSLQIPGGGFRMDDIAFETFGIDLEKVNQELLGANPANHGKNLRLLRMKHLLDRLETRFCKDMPYLTNIIRTHRKWLVKGLR